MEKDTTFGFGGLQFHFLPLFSLYSSYPGLLTSSPTHHLSGFSLAVNSFWNALLLNGHRTCSAHGDTSLMSHPLISGLLSQHFYLKNTILHPVPTFSLGFLMCVFYLPVTEIMRLYLFLISLFH